MDPISSITGSSGITKLGGNRLSSGDDFLKILSAQISSQNPLEPMEETQFLSQLAQFSQLEETVTMRNSLQAMGLLQDSLAAIDQMTQGANLIGKTVEYTDPETGETASGEVEAIRIEDGLVVLDVGEERTIPLALMTAVVSGEE